jgi:hypothetical protein
MLGAWAMQRRGCPQAKRCRRRSVIHRPCTAKAHATCPSGQSRAHARTSAPMRWAASRRCSSHDAADLAVSAYCVVRRSNRPSTTLGNRVGRRRPCLSDLSQITAEIG